VDQEASAAVGRGGQLVDGGLADQAYRVSGDVWLGAAPFAAAWIHDDLDQILLHDRQPPLTDAPTRWSELVPEG
jgi:hypothetical protein